MKHQLSGYTWGWEWRSEPLLSFPELFHLQQNVSPKRMEVWTVVCSSISRAQKSSREQLHSKYLLNEWMNTQMETLQRCRSIEFWGTRTSSDIMMLGTLSAESWIQQGAGGGMTTVTLPAFCCPLCLASLVVSCLLSLDSAKWVALPSGRHTNVRHTKTCRCLCTAALGTP